MYLGFVVVTDLQNSVIIDLQYVVITALRAIDIFVTNVGSWCTTRISQNQQHMKGEGQRHHGRVENPGKIEEIDSSRAISTPWTPAKYSFYCLVACQASAPDMAKAVLCYQCNTTGNNTIGTHVHTCAPISLPTQLPSCDVWRRAKHHLVS